jgi:hypothetical protein
MGGVQGMGGSRKGGRGGYPLVARGPMPPAYKQPKNQSLRCCRRMWRHVRLTPCPHSKLFEKNASFFTMKDAGFNIWEWINTFRVCYPYSEPSPPLTEAGWRLVASYHWPASNGSLNKGVDFSNVYSARSTNLP